MSCQVMVLHNQTRNQYLIWCRFMNGEFLDNLSQYIVNNKCFVLNKK